ncbi:nuclear transport factor 2 family protein [Streptomyces tanashiensis]|uniref:nuclear transport factor 2 family protein n=1 Tax=Streptomyces tanashiensis TaxID=67367 RepID=UPI0036E1A8B7
MTHISSDVVREISRAWAESFSSGDARAFAQKYSEGAEYIDHAFQLRRTGRRSIELHYNLWIDSIADFEMKVDRIDVVGQRAFFSYVGTGRFVKDLPRLAATGTSFTYEGVVILTVDDDGLVGRTEEFYSTNFPTGVPFENYHFRGSDTVSA